MTDEQTTAPADPAVLTPTDQPANVVTDTPPAPPDAPTDPNATPESDPQPEPNSAPGSTPETLPDPGTAQSTPVDPTPDTNPADPGVEPTGPDIPDEPGEPTMVKPSVPKGQWDKPADSRMLFAYTHPACNNVVFYTTDPSYQMPAMDCPICKTALIPVVPTGYAGVEWPKME